MLFFVGGGYFGYAVGFPMVAKFLVATGEDFMPVLKIDDYLDITSKILLGMGLVFETPILIFFLARMGVVTEKWLLAKFRYAVLIIFIISALITPTPDIPDAVRLRPADVRALSAGRADGVGLQEAGAEEGVTEPVGHDRGGAAATARGGLPGLLDAWRSCRQGGSPSVVALVTGTSGSTYRKPGAMALLDEQGLRFGAVSGGCLEPELERRARHVLATHRSESAFFDTSDDSDRVYGSGVGCLGRIETLLMPLPVDSSAHLLASLERAVSRRTALRVSVAVAGSDLGAGEARDGTSARAWSPEGLESPPSSPRGPSSRSTFPGLLLFSFSAQGRRRPRSSRSPGGWAGRRLSSRRGAAGPRPRARRERTSFTSGRPARPSTLCRGALSMRFS